ncbi:UNVERIFIED_CONTAM: Pectinesterase/pectinesterase inhibitor PPE8B [Sesamum angustifolium]|uniref:Pectinesterase/pectinesterase inhibitor PPE8B n=1 Tax=Sesamum angustifolium TaxID=2727405 RepID=A0AAW2MUC0_9LAMI
MGGSPLLKLLFLVVLLCASFTAGKSSSSSDFVPSEYLGVPASEFVGTVRSTIDIIRQVMSMVSQFSGGFGDFRLTNAISDCLDLMDLSMDQLSWTLSASQNPNGKDNSTGNVGADMKTWLSGALINQDTCKEGLDGTNSIVKNLIAGSLDQVTSLVYDILSNVKTTPTTPPKGAPSNGPGGGKGSGSGGGGRGGRKLIADDHQFPGWLRSHDRNLLQAANGALADVVVAADGTGNFTSIKDAVQAAPEYSTKRSTQS